MNLRAWFDSDEFRQAYHWDAPLGAFAEGGWTRFLLWAPTAESVTLRLYEDGSDGRPYASTMMTPLAQGVWFHEAEEDLHGVYYDYLVTVDGVTRRTADPYARACGLNGARSMVVDLRRTDPDGWAEDKAPVRQAEDVIYELHVKDFSWDPASGVPADKRGKFAALTLRGTTLNGDGAHPTCVDHILRMGATHVQLMPVYDYGSVDEVGGAEQFNWGYDPVNYNIPEGSYASDAARGEVRIREMKEAVQALHRAGLRVIMDVVYNHTYELDSWLFRTVPWYYYRQNEDGSASNGSGCGTEIASERSMCGKYILDSVMYWAQEYHIDGFRFDLMGMMDVPLMNRIRQALDEQFGAGEKLVYGEPWTGGACHPRPGTMLADKGNIRSLDRGVGAFCDNTRDGIKGSVMQAESRGFVNGGGLNAAHLACCVRGWSGEGGAFIAPSQTISYLSCHDDWTLWDKLVYTMDGMMDFAGSTPRILAANRLAAAILMCCQGRLFFLSGEEFARTKLGVKNSYCSPLSINRMDWQRSLDNAALAEYYRGLIALRKQLPGLCDKSETAAGRIICSKQVGENAAALLLHNHGEGSRYDQLLMMFNASGSHVQVALPVGRWAVLADGDDSFLWQHPSMVEGTAVLPPMSAMILGRTDPA
ncbi:MAG: type I pullulanase [Clostridia bacterium]|nr:type I pullulanase [Clostridia bacterium]